MAFLFKVSILSFFLLASCSSTQNEESQTLSVMSFNVETLFDTEHDVNKGRDKLDYTYLPLELKKGRLRSTVDKYCATIQRKDWKEECQKLNWTREILAEKLYRIGRVIKESTTGCPDVVVLQEVENDKVIKQLLEKELTECGYESYVISDDRDARGIDIAILSKFVVLASRTLDPPAAESTYETLKDTRGVLEATFLAKGTRVRILGVHFPAPFHPAAVRDATLGMLRQNYLDKKVPTIIAGDWNVIRSEETKLKNYPLMRKDFILSDDTLSSGLEKGTTYYAKDGTWTFLDKMAWGRNHFSNIECRVARVIPEQSDQNGQPESYKELGDKLLGVSDHFPILCSSSL